MAYQNHMLKSDLVSETGALGTATRFPPSSGSGADVTAAAVTSAIGDTSAAQQFTIRSTLNVPKNPTVVTVSGTDANIMPLADVYVCGTLDSLTITDPPADGAYIIEFDSGATPTVTTIPAGIIGLEDFAAEANTHYEINVRNGYALVGSWAVSSS